MNNRKLYIYVLCIILLFLNSCSIVYKKNKFVDYKNDNEKIINRLKCNGYYYYEYTYNSSTCENKKSIKPIILYKNGTAYVMTGSISGLGWDSFKQKHSSNDIQEYNTFECAHETFYKVLKKHSKKYKKDVQDWGVYHIVGDTLILYHYKLASSGNILPIVPYELKKTIGIIKNDSTFILLKGLTGQENDVYQFRQYAQKPDSLNPTIRSRVFKSKWWPPVYIPLLDFN